MFIEYPQKYIKSLHGYNPNGVIQRNSGYIQNLDPNAPQDCNVLNNWCGQGSWDTTTSSGGNNSGWVDFLGNVLGAVLGNNNSQNYPYHLPEQKKDNTALYVGIGVGAIVIILLLFLILRK